ncbi:hypothetical protein B9Z19DRAFT_1084500 [Tuber borchii]|uniref:Uncharacterized protein n=1 Tax=Tuber borchii TaxID=42251 RepID=A0A2T6ZRV0_TUBBO|nr:hypothetical protein B9Z19DRAFT_1084500 [Tuber borchii]
MHSNLPSQTNVHIIIITSWQNQETRKKENLSQSRSQSPHLVYLCRSSGRCEQGQGGNKAPWG